MPHTAAAPTAGGGSGPLTPASPADVTLSSWFLEETDGAGTGTTPSRRLAVIVLNQPLPHRLAPALLARADLVVAADGGADRLFHAAPGWAAGVAGGDADAARLEFLPAAIVGDLDSLSPAVRAFYEGRGVRVVDCSPDQDSTDLEKALTYVHRTVVANEEAQGGAADDAWAGTTVVALGALGGPRLDHTLSALSTLFKPVGGGSGGGGSGGGGGGGEAGAWAPNLVLIGDGCAARALPSGGGTVAVEPAPCEAGGHCGLVALGPPAAGARTAGLAWDLGAGSPPLAVGGLQSTSNRVVGRGADGRPRVVVEVVAGSGDGGRGGGLVWTSEVGL